MVAEIVRISEIEIRFVDIVAILGKSRVLILLAVPKSKRFEADDAVTPSQRT
jgi:hypothetical protein